MIEAEHGRTVQELKIEIARLHCQLELAKKDQSGSRALSETSGPYDSTSNGEVQSKQQSRQSRQESRQSRQESRQSRQESRQSRQESRESRQESEQPRQESRQSKTESPLSGQPSDVEPHSNAGLEVHPELDPVDDQESAIMSSFEENAEKLTANEVSHNMNPFSSQPQSSTSIGKSGSWRSFMKKVLSHPIVEAAVGIIIVVNTVLMMLETQYKGNETGYMVGARGMDISAQESWPHAGEVFEYSERIFTIIYTM